MDAQHTDISLTLSQNPGARVSKYNSQKFIKAVLKRDLPGFQTKSVEQELQRNFLLSGHSARNKAKPQRKKKRFLTRKERKQLNLLKLPKTGWNYHDLQPMRQLWKEYMRKNLDMQKKAPTCEDSAFQNFNISLAKSEFIGADITVTRSLVPNSIGTTGTVVLETKSAFHIITPNSQLKCLLKKPSVFTFTLDNMLFTIFGKHMIIKPSERSVKKVKSQVVPDL